MTEADEPTLPIEPGPGEQVAGPQLPGFLVAMTALAWIVAGTIAIMEWRSYSEARDDFTISAPQVSQVADELFAAVLPWVVCAVGMTAIAVVGALARLVTLAHRSVD
jgi:hypothetical protein